MNDITNDPESLERAKQIAKRSLAGEYDLLLACREVADLRTQLPGLPEGLLHTFVAVASEIDDLPIGNERTRWATDVLKSKDIEANEYRERVRGLITDALQKLLTVADGDGHNTTYY